MLRKAILAAAIFFVLISAGYAKVLFERSLESFGYDGFEASTESAEQCRDFAVFLEDLNGYAFVTLVASFLPSNKGSATIECFFNGVPLEKAYAENFECNAGLCTAYVPIANSLLKKESMLRICLRPSKSIAKINLSNKSKIGLYAMGIFEKDEFKKCVVAGKDCVENYNAVLGEDLRVKIIAKNSGNEDANVLIYAIRPIVPEDETKKELGNIAFTETIGAGESKEIYYIVRVKQLTLFNLPPSALYYTDAFGRRIHIFSNPVTIVPKEKPDVNAIIFPKTESDSEATVGVTITNNSGVELAGVEVMLTGDNIMALPEKQIFSIAPRDLKTAEFSVKKTSKKLGCIVKIKDYNMEVGCNTIELAGKEANILPFVFAGLLLLIGAAAVFFYLHSLPEE